MLMTRTTLLLVLLYGFGAWFGGAPSPLQAIFGTARGEAGCNMDPDGRCLVAVPATDEGCNMDPNGNPTCKPDQ